MKSKWILPILFILTVVFCISSIVTYCKYDRIKTLKVIEGMKNSTGKAREYSIEKARELLSNLMVYINSKYPQRSDLSGKPLLLRNNLDWQDLTLNKNDFKWGTEPKLDDGFLTQGHHLTGQTANKLKFDKTREFSVIIKSASLSGNFNEATLNQGDEISEADILDGAQENMTDFKIPPSLRESFDNLKNLLKEEGNEQNSEEIRKEVQNVHQELKRKNINKLKKNTTALKIYGNQDVAFSIGIPDNYGSLEINIAGKLYLSEHKFFSKDMTSYTVVYKNTDIGGVLSAYVNSAKVINNIQVNKMHFNEMPIVINPSGKWDARLKEVSILNRYLHPAEVALFRNEGIIVKALAHNYDKHKLVPGMDQPNNCKCKATCKSSSGMFNPFNSHTKEQEDTKYDCEGLCECENGDDIDPFNKPNNKVCPKVHIDDLGNYIWNSENYGNDRKKAREIYITNHPSCHKIPKVLSEGWHKKRRLPPNFPFKVDSDLNPYRRRGCRNVDWSAHSPDGLNRKCKRNISEYCREYPDLDDFCTCWRKEYRNTPQCKKYRSNFEDPREYGFGPNSFDISDHPDYDKYIRKDKIPCWGCSLKQASGEEVCNPEKDPTCK